MLTRQAVMEADLVQYTVELQAESRRESIRADVMLRLLRSAVGIVGQPTELPVRLILNCGLISSFYQVFRLSADGATDGLGHWEPHVLLLDDFFFTQFLPIAESDGMVDAISGYRGLLINIRHLRETHPWFQPPPDAEDEADVGGGVSEEEEYDSEYESSVANTSDELSHAIVHQHDRQAIRSERRQATAELKAFREWLDATGQRSILDEFSNFLGNEHRRGRYLYAPLGH